MGNKTIRKFFVLFVFCVLFLFQAQKPVMAMDGDNITFDGDEEVQEIVNEPIQSVETDSTVQQVNEQPKVLEDSYIGEPIEESIDYIEEKPIDEIESMEEPISNIEENIIDIEKTSNSSDDILDVQKQNILSENTSEEVINEQDNEQMEFGIKEVESAEQVEQSDVSDLKDVIKNDDLTEIKSEEIDTEESKELITLSNFQKGSTAIYVDGKNGDDNKDGSSKENAVKTFEKAKELATTNQEIQTIYVVGTVPVSGEISLAGTNAVLKRESSFNGYLLNVGTGKTVNLKNITIDGNFEEATNASNSLVNVSSGTLHIEDGTILQNNKIASESFKREGGAISVRSGTVNMTGGLIQDNNATWGGGVFITGNGVFNMSSGTIQNNEVINGPGMDTYWNYAAAGGGICIYDGGTVNISGNALIQNNHSEEVGGGISVGTIEASLNRSNYLNMFGGTIDGNTAGASGGGIFVQAAYTARNKNNKSQAKITAGNITNNGMLDTGITNSLFGGGGIYVNGYDFQGFKNGELFLENVIVTDNESRYQGGGYASCPISKTKIYVTDGGAIYGNSGSSAEDIFIYSQIAGFGAHGGNPEYDISNMMLGGIPYNWKDIDGNEVPLNQLKGVLKGEGTSFSLYTDSVGDGNTSSLAKVLITGNYSETRGGGIGSNGEVTIGKKDPTEINIEKIWDDENDSKGIRPESIIIELWRRVEGSDSVYIGYETITPDELGNWEMTFNNLVAKDNYDNAYEYFVKERKVDGYVSTITGDAENGFVITNCLELEKPKDPPSETPKQEDPPKQIETPQFEFGYIVPNTGDERTIYIWMVLILVSIGGLIIMKKRLSK